jgi:molybdate transport system substrate-binding protein
VLRGRIARLSSSGDDMSVAATRRVAHLSARARGVAFGLCVTMLSLAAASAAKAAELQIFCANGLKPVLANLAPLFEAASGDKANVSFDEAAVLLRRLQAGERPDVLILTRSALEELATSGQVVPETLKTVASADALGIVARAGTTQRDTSTVAGLKDWLLAVKSIAVTDPAVGGLAVQQFFKVIDQLGITEQLKPKWILAKGTGVSNARLISSGEAEAAVQLAYLLRPVEGIEVVAVPKEFQLTVTFAAAVGAGSSETSDARAFVDFLAGPTAAHAIEAAGMRPGSS